MPKTFYSRDEINTTLNEVVANCNLQYPYMKECVSVSDTKALVENLISSLKDQFGIMPEPQQRLILSLTYEIVSERQHPLIVDRAHVLKAAFAKRFPDTPQFREIAQMFVESSDWKYFFVGCTDEHVEWAKAAKDCGMIDNYIVDYDPS